MEINPLAEKNQLNYSTRTYSFIAGTTSRLSKISNVADDSISIQLLKTLLAETFEIKFVKEKGNVLNSLIMEVR